jgi:hypothetical protein
MNGTVRLTVATILTAFTLAVAFAIPGEIFPDASVSFRATFESQKEAQEYLGAFFLARKYRVQMKPRETSDFFYAHSPSGADIAASGSIRAGIRACILVDFYFAGLQLDISKRDAELRAQAASEASELVAWLRASGAESIALLDAAPLEERSKCQDAL